MKENTKVLLGSFIGIGMAVGLLFYLNQHPISKKTDEELSQNLAKKVNYNFDSLPNGSESIDLADSVLLDKNFSFSHAIEQARKGKLDLYAELTNLYKRCDKLVKNKCLEKIVSILPSSYSSTDKRVFEEIFNKVIQYEEYVQTLKQSGKDSPEQKDSIRQKRTEIFGDKDRQLLFGLDESKTDLEIAFQELVNNKNILSGEEKLRLFEETKRRTLGIYYETIISSESRFDKYKAEVKLRKFELTDSKNKEEVLKSIRIKHFGRETALKMEPGFWATIEEGRSISKIEEERLLSQNSTDKKKKNQESKNKK